jgi:hypothetical protein
MYGTLSHMLNAYGFVILKANTNEKNHDVDTMNSSNQETIYHLHKKIRYYIPYLFGPNYFLLQ